MADEILYAGLGDLTTAEALTGEYEMLLSDANALPNHPALIYLGDASMYSSKVIKLPLLGLGGYDRLDSIADGTSLTNKAFADGSLTVTIGRYGKVYNASDMAKMFGAGKLLNTQMFAQDAYIAAMMTLCGLVADVVDGFTTTFGSSGVNATLENFLDCLTALEVAKVTGPYMAMLHPVQWGDIRKDGALSAGGSIQWSAASQEMLNVRGLGYQGQLFGADVFTSTEVKTANSGADRAGGVWGRRGVVWADASVMNEGDPNQLIIAGKVLVERQRTARAGTTDHVAAVHMGASKGLDACGVSLITDA